MRKQCKQWQSLFSWASKSLQMVTAAMKLKGLLLGRKAMTNLDSILKSRDVTLPTNVHLVKAMVFPVVMYGCESWSIKKAGFQRTDAFELWCWRRLLRESLGLQGDSTSLFSRKSVLNIHWKDWCWNWNSNTLATYCKELTHWKRPWCWARLKAGGKGEDRMKSLMASPTHGHEFELQEMVKDKEARHAAVHGVAKSQTQLNWTK